MSQKNIIPDKILEDLIRRCTDFPWQVSLDTRYGNRVMTSVNASAARNKVCFAIPVEVSNYDVRLWTMAPVLALEVLELRRELRKYT